MSFAPHLAIKQEAKRVTKAEAMIEELLSAVRVSLVQLLSAPRQPAKGRVADGLNPTEKKI